MSEQEPGKGYGSKWKKYIVWYIIGAIVVYGLVYVLFFSDKY